MLKTLLALAVVLLSSAKVISAEPIVVVVGASPLLPQQPQIAVDENGSVHLVYGVQNDTYYSQSSDGISFSKPVKLPSVNVMSLGMRRGPRIAVANDRLCVTVIGGKQARDATATCLLSARRMAARPGAIP